MRGHVGTFIGLKLKESILFPFGTLNGKSSLSRWAEFAVSTLPTNPKIGQVEIGD